MRCIYCGWHNGTHAEHCPSNTPPNSPEKQRFNEGLADGQAYKKRDQFKIRDPVYAMGYSRGVLTADEFNLV